MFTFVFALLFAVGLTGCDQGGASSDGETRAENDSPKTLVLYLGRSSSLVSPVIEAFEKQTGIDVEIKDGATPDLAALLKVEGKATVADVFWAQDPGALGDLAAADLLAKLPATVTEKVASRFVDDEKYWVATSGRARVLAYAPSRVNADELPDSVFDLTDKKYRGRIGWAPGNGSFQAFVTAMRAVHGDDRTRQWLTDMKANDPKVYPKNTPIIEALAAGEIDLGLPNHYYLLRFKASQGNDYPVEQQFFADKNIGNLLMVAGVGITRTAKNRAAAEAFVAFLLSEWAQSYFAESVFEYPVAGGVTPHAMLIDTAKLNDIVPDVNVQQMSDQGQTRQLLQEVGLF